MDAGAKELAWPQSFLGGSVLKRLVSLFGKPEIDGFRELFGDVSSGFRIGKSG